MKFTLCPLMIAALFARAEITDAKLNKISQVKDQASTTDEDGRSRLLQDAANGGEVIGAIFTSTNSPPAYTNHTLGSELVMYHQMQDGTLKGPAGRYQTGDTGINTGSSQYMVIVSGNQVFVANGANNPYSNSTDPPARGEGSVSAFSFTKYGALRTAVTPSGGPNPISLALCDKILYVANAALINGQNSLGGTPSHPTLNSSITALQVEDNGGLSPVESLTQDLGLLSRAVGVEVTPDKKYLLVIVSGFAELRAYNLDNECMITGDYATSMVRSVATSIAEFGGKNYVYAGSPLDGGVSAFAIDDGMALINEAIGPGSPSAALCWTAISGKYLYTTNAGVFTISSFLINEEDGSIALLKETAVNTGFQTSPLDMYVYGSFLYVLLGGTGNIAVYSILDNGDLELYENFEAGLPANNDAPLNFNRAGGLARGEFASTDSTTSGAEAMISTVGYIMSFGLAVLPLFG